MWTGMWTVLLLIISNVFMIFAWYGHLKYRSAPMWGAVLASRQYHFLVT